MTVRIDDPPDRIYLTDDGIDTSKRECEHVFESGYSTALDGPGFGLRIVKQMLDAHGWTIDLTESDSGGAQSEISGADIGE